jgi:pentatricopeptide repeat protein
MLAHTSNYTHFYALNKGVKETIKITMMESYNMQGDLKKALKMIEDMLQDIEHIQSALGLQSASSTDVPMLEPVPEVFAAQKLLANAKFAYMAEQQRSSISYNLCYRMINY